MSDTVKEVESMMNEEQLGAFRSMLGRLGPSTRHAVNRMSDGRLRHVAIDDGRATLHVRFNLVQSDPRPADRRHFFESLEFRTLGRPDGEPACVVWHDDGSQWCYSNWRDGKLIEHSVHSIGGPHG